MANRLRCVVPKSSTKTPPRTDLAAPVAASLGPTPGDAGITVITATDMVGTFLGANLDPGACQHQYTYTRVLHADAVDRDAPVADDGDAVLTYDAAEWVIDPLFTYGSGNATVS